MAANFEFFPHFSFNRESSEEPIMPIIRIKQQIPSPPVSPTSTSMEYDDVIGAENENIEDDKKLVNIQTAEIHFENLRILRAQAEEAETRAKFEKEKFNQEQIIGELYESLSEKTVKF